MIEDRGRMQVAAGPDRRDQAAAEEIWRQGSYAGQTFQPGQFVALLQGHVVAVTTTLREAEDALARAENEPLSGLIVEVADPGIDVIR
jgi:hypothetical protein